MNYLKYYWLEQEYLEREVQPFFLANGFLTAKHFFAIIKWKRPGNASLIKNIFLRNVQTGDKESTENTLNNIVMNITKDIAEAATKEKRIEKLMNKNGFQLAMASAVLTILYPDTFTVYDWRVRGQIDCPDITYQRDRVRKYFDKYVKQVLERGREITQNPTLSLRDCDRILWAKSWYESFEKFLTNR